MNNGLRLTRDQKSGSGSSAGKTEHVRYDYSYNQGLERQAPPWPNGTGGRTCTMPPSGRLAAPKSNEGEVEDF